MNRRFLGQRVGALVSIVVVGCAGAEPGSEGFLAHCIDGRPGVESEPSVVCRVDGDGNVQSVSDVELAPGVPFVVDPVADRIAAELISGDLVVVSGGDPAALARDGSGVAYAFDDSGTLLGLDSSGAVRTSDGSSVVTFDIEGSVDTKSGSDVAGGIVTFTVERPDGGFAVAVGELRTGAVDTIATSDRYVGQSRISPDGTRIAHVGVDYRSIEVTDPTGVPIVTFEASDRSLSGRLIAPRWFDDGTVMFQDAVPALLVGDVSSGDIDVIAQYDPGADRFPFLNVPLTSPSS